MSESPDVLAAMRLIDAAKTQGLTFQRIAPGPDGPLRAVRETPLFVYELYIAGMWAPASCSAIRRRRTALILPSGLPVIDQVTGNALTVLNTVVTTWLPLLRPRSAAGLSTRRPHPKEHGPRQPLTFSMRSDATPLAAWRRSSASTDRSAPALPHTSRLPQTPLPASPGRCPCRCRALTVSSRHDDAGGDRAESQAARQRRASDLRDVG